jgi:hypothetical protein
MAVVVDRLGEVRTPAVDAHPLVRHADDLAPTRRRSFRRVHASEYPPSRGGVRGWVSFAYQQE